jgi:ribose transport system permease protein
MVGKTRKVSTTTDSSELSLRQHESTISQKVRHFLLYYGSLTGFVIIFLVFSIIAPNFLTAANLITMLRQVSIVAVMAFGITFVLILGGLDLSIAGIPGFAATLAAVLLSKGYGNAFAITCGIGAGMLLGLVNGLIATKLRVGIYLSGLAVSFIARGLDLWIARYEPIYKGVQDNPFFLWLGQGMVGPLPTVFAIALFLFAVLHFCMTQTRVGRNMYAIGGSSDGAAACGINIDRYKIAGLCMSGLFGAIGGILLTARTGVAIPRAAEGLWLDVLLASVFGTTVLSGGVPHILGTGVGVLFTGVLLNGFTQFNVHEFHQMLIKGVLIVASVALCTLGGKILNVELK